MTEWNQFTFPISDNALRLINLNHFPSNLTYSLIPSQDKAKLFFEFIKNFHKEIGRSFCICGPCQSGKTVLASCMIRQLVAANRGWGLYLSFVDLYELKQNAIQITPGEPDTYWDECLITDLLMIDDIGYENYSNDFAANLLLRVLKARNDRRKSTAIFTHLTPTELKRKYGDLLIENIKTKMEVVILKN